MSNAEIFLMVWAGLGTLLAVLYREASKRFRHAHRETSVLLAELALGEVKPTHKDGYTTVENDAMRLTFKKREDNDGVQE